jgi:hypothetical protein
MPHEASAKSNVRDVGDMRAGIYAADVLGQERRQIYLRSDVSHRATWFKCTTEAPADDVQPTDVRSLCRQGYLAKGAARQPLT